MAKSIENILRELSFVEPELSSFVTSEDFSLPVDLESEALRLIAEVREQGGSVYYSEQRSEGIVHWRNASFSGPTRILLPLLDELCSARFDLTP